MWFEVAFTSETCGFFYGTLTVSVKQYLSTLKYP